MKTDAWFDYPILVQPHHTDYAGWVWHGTYLAWMEEARIAALRETGIHFADLVAMGCDLPVIHLSLDYYQAIKMGTSVRVRSRLNPVQRVRLIWTQRICAVDTDLCYVAAQVVLVPIDPSGPRVLRHLPPILQGAIAHLQAAPDA